MEDDKGMLNCGKGNELLIYPSSGVANEFFSIQYSQSDPIEISDANSNQRYEKQIKYSSINIDDCFVHVTNCKYITANVLQATL